MAIFTGMKTFIVILLIKIEGHEYPAIVEFAPNQKIPKNSRSRKDAKCGTVDEDPDFLKFVETLQNPSKSTRTVQQCLEDIDAREKELKRKYNVINERVYYSSRQAYQSSDSYENVENIKGLFY